MAAEEVLESSAYVHQLLKVILSTSQRPSAQTINRALYGQHNSGPEVRTVSFLTQALDWIPNKQQTL